MVDTKSSFFYIMCLLLLLSMAFAAYVISSDTHTGTNENYYEQNNIEVIQTNVFQNRNSRPEVSNDKTNVQNQNKQENVVGETSKETSLSTPESHDEFVNANENSLQVDNVNKENTILQIASEGIPKEFIDLLSFHGTFKYSIYKDYHEFLSNIDKSGSGFLLATRMEEFIQSRKEWDYKLDNVRCSYKLCELRGFGNPSSDIAFKLKFSGHFNEIISIKGLKKDGTFNIRSRNGKMSVSVFLINLDRSQ